MPGIGAIQVLRNAVGGGGCVSFPGKKRYKGVRFNVISVTRGWVSGGQISRKNLYVTLEWPHTSAVGNVKIVVSEKIVLLLHPRVDIPYRLVYAT